MRSNPGPTSSDVKYPSAQGLFHLFPVGDDIMARIYILILFIIFSIAIHAASASDWPLFKKGCLELRHHLRPGPENPVILWSADVQRMETTPIVCSGLIYALAGNGSIYAMNRETGDLIWQSQLEGWVYQMSSPACSGTKIFAATDSGLLAALDSLTGDVLWTREITDKRFESPLMHTCGRLYLRRSAYGTGQKRFFCFDENGSECWGMSPGAQKAISGAEPARQGSI